MANTSVKKNGAAVPFVRADPGQACCLRQAISSAIVRIGKPRSSAKRSMSAPRSMLPSGFISSQRKWGAVAAAVVERHRRQYEAAYLVGRQAGADDAAAFADHPAIVSAVSFSAICCLRIRRGDSSSIAKALPAQADVARRPGVSSLPRRFFDASCQPGQPIEVVLRGAVVRDIAEDRECEQSFLGNPYQF
jgi:hypothetical protein